MTAEPKTPPEKEIIRAFEAAGVIEYLEYLQSGKRILWVNFKAGIAKGFGITIGASVVVGLIVWILTMLVDLPLVGEYFESAEQYVNDYVDKTDYTDEFAEMTRVLEEINENIEQDTTEQDNTEQDNTEQDNTEQN
jgi:uncharacterized membrane protein YhiD involved in acid resistance